MNHAIKKFCSDKDGKLILAQRPNLPLIGWLILKLASILVSNQQLKIGLQGLSSTMLFVWAYLEVSDGDSGLRRVLGGVMIALLILSMFT